MDTGVPESPLWGNTEPTQSRFPRLARRRLLFILDAPTAQIAGRGANPLSEMFCKKPCVE